MHRVKSAVTDLLLLIIITAPAFFRILNNQYFSMHDDQHVVRLYLLDQGLKLGYLYPRWVDGLGFGFGYPLYNFYPPLIYYVAELFHILGFSLIWSAKLVFILGFYLGAVGIYLLVKKLTNRLSGFLSATLYTYFFYHAVLIYVRGALAEFFSMAILPFVFLSIENLADKAKWRNAIWLGISLALLILTHPLIALPTTIFIGFSFIFYLFLVKKKYVFIKYIILGGLIGLGLSAFFWLPSMVERKYTLTDQILTGELASYKLHYIYPQQFIYSPWGYGGSTAGLSDGMTFQLGKIHIGLVILTLILSTIFYILERFRHSGERSDSRIVVLNNDSGFIPRIHPEGQAGMTLRYFYFFVFLLLFSLFMTTVYSSFIWDRVKYLWYLQFPWRFLTFTTIFISITGGYFIFFLSRLSEQHLQLPRLKILKQQSVYYFLTLFLIFGTIIIYTKYFKPQRVLSVTDKDLITREEISWRISRTSYEFVPKGVKTKKTELNTTVLDIEKKDLSKKPYKVISGKGVVQVSKNKFQEKEFSIEAKTPLIFQLNTYNFPGWTAYLTSLSVIPSPSTIAQGKLESRNLKIFDNNDFKLISVNIPKGKYNLKFVFANTPVRNIANLISLAILIIILFFFKKLKKVDR